MSTSPDSKRVGEERVLMPVPAAQRWLSETEWTGGEGDAESVLCGRGVLGVRAAGAG